jgi:hypothetical protein
LIRLDDLIPKQNVKAGLQPAAAGAILSRRG